MIDCSKGHFQTVIQKPTKVPESPYIDPTERSISPIMTKNVNPMTEKNCIERPKRTEYRLSNVKKVLVAKVRIKNKIKSSPIIVKSLDFEMVDIGFLFKILLIILF